MTKDQKLIEATENFIEDDKNTFRIQTISPSSPPLDTLKKKTYDVIVLDQPYLTQTSLQDLKTLRKKQSTTSFLLLLKQDSSPLMEKAKKAGIDKIVDKNLLDSSFDILKQVILQECKKDQSKASTVKQTSLLETIKNVSQIIIHNLDSSALYQKVLKVLLYLEGCSEVDLTLFNSSLEQHPKIYRATETLEKWGINWKNTQEKPRCVKNLSDTLSTRFIENTQQFCQNCHYCRSSPSTKLLLFPVVLHSSLIGILTFYFEKSIELAKTDIQLLEEVAKDLAKTIERRKAKKEKNLATARAKIKAERAITKKEARFEKLFEATPDGVFILNKKGEIEEVNEAACNIFGYNQDRLKGKVLWQIGSFPETSREKLKHHINQTFQDKTTPPYTIKIQNQNGATHYLEMHTTLLVGSGITGDIIGTARDITERKEAEEKLEVLHSWARLLARADTMDEIFNHTLDAMEKTLNFENALIAMKDEDILKVQNYRGFEFLTKQEHLNGNSISNKAANTGNTVLINDRTDHPTYKAPSSKTKSEIAVPIKIANEVIGVLNVESTEKNTFTEQDKKLLEQLASHVAVAIKELKEKQQRVSLQRLDDLRTKFIAMTAHEFGTPLTSINTALETLLRGYYGGLSPKQKEKVHSALNSVNRLHRLIKDFRRSSKLRSGRITLEKQHHYLAETVEQALTEYHKALETKAIQLETAVPQSLSAEYDKDRIIQVIQNLVKNAIDFTKDTICIQAGENETTIWFSVKDNGIGIPKEEQEKIFQPFYTGKPNKNIEDREYGGTGLGLHLCKQIIDEHHGIIELESTPNKGTTFTITLPKHAKQNHH